MMMATAAEVRIYADRRGREIEIGLNTAYDPNHYYVVHCDSTATLQSLAKRAVNEYLVSPCYAVIIMGGTADMCRWEELEPALPTFNVFPRSSDPENLIKKFTRAIIKADQYVWANAPCM